MASVIGNGLGSLLLRSWSSFLIGVLLVPAMVRAESLHLIRTAVTGSAEPVHAEHTDNRPLRVGLDKNGDVTVYYCNVSITVSYNPVDTLPPARERVALDTSPDASAIGGLGIKVGFAF